MSKKRLMIIISLLLAAMIAVVIILGAVYTFQKVQKGAPGSLRIGVIYSRSPGFQNTYALSHKRGIEAMQKKLGIKDSQIIQREDVWTDDEKTIAIAMEELLNENCSLIIATDSDYNDVCERYANDHPDTVFAVPLGAKTNGKNLVSCNVRAYEASYLSGVVAGKNSASGHIGYVSCYGNEDPVSSTLISSFAMGVASVNPDTTVDLYITGSWFDSLTESIAAEYLIGKNCDIIAQNCNTLSPQSAAAHAGVGGIGFDVDMSEIAPDSVITSVVWNWDVYYSWLVEKILDGTFSGENYVGGLEDGLISVTEPSQKASLGTAEALSDAKNKILDKSLQIFSQEEFENGLSDYFENVKEAGISSSSSSMEGNSENAIEIAIQPSSAFMPLYVARANGWIEEALKKYGITVTWSDFESGPPMNAFFASGSGHIGVAGDVPVISALANGQDNIFIGCIEAGASYCLIVPAESRINSIADLRGKTVGTVVGSTSHNVLKKFLESEGLSLSDIKFYEMAGGGDTALVLSDGTCDAVSIWEPTATSLQAAGKARIIADGSDIGFPGVNVIFARRSYLEENPEIVKEVLTQFVRGAQMLNEYPDATARKIAGYFNLEPPVLASLIDKYDYKMVFSESDINSLQDTVSFQLEMGNIKNGIYVKNYIGDSISREIMNELQNSFTTSETKETP